MSPDLYFPFLSLLYAIERLVLLLFVLLGVAHLLSFLIVVIVISMIWMAGSISLCVCRLANYFALYSKLQGIFFGLLLGGLLHDR